MTNDQLLLEEYREVLSPPDLPTPEQAIADRLKELSIRELPTLTLRYSVGFPIQRELPQHS
jgi:hypothetical protein